MPAGMAWGLNLPLLALAAWTGWRLTARGTPAARAYWPALALRLAGGLALGVVYVSPWFRFDRGGDTTALSEQALAFSAWGQGHGAAYARLLLTGADQPGSPLRLYTTFSNSHFFVRGLSLLNFFTGGSYWLNGLWLSLAAFGGSWLLVRELVRRVPGAWRGACLGALAWPSVLFWMSGVSKDALLLAALGAFTAAALRLIYPPSLAAPAVSEAPAPSAVLTAPTTPTVPRPGRRWWVLLVGAGWLFWKVKFFIAVVVFVAFGALALAERLGPPLQTRWPRVRGWWLLLILALALAPLSRVAHRAFRPDYLLPQVLKNQRELHVADPDQPALRLPLRPSLASFAQWAPVAAAGVFTRPWLWEGAGRRWRAAGLENAALLALLGWAVSSWAVRCWWRRGRPPQVPLLAVALLLVVGVVAVMFGLTTPNLGSLHRYRAVLLPFAFYLGDWLRAGDGAAIRAAAAARAAGDVPLY